MEVVENIESMIHILIDSIPKVENKWGEDGSNFKTPFT
jgi:hypothetical protein